MRRRQAPQVLFGDFDEANAAMVLPFPRISFAVARQCLDCRNASWLTFSSNYKRKKKEKKKATINNI